MKYFVLIITIIIFLILFADKNVEEQLLHYSYYPVNGDNLKIYLIGNLNNFNYFTKVVDNKIMLQKYSLEDLQPHYADIMEIKGKNLKDISDELIKYYSKETGIQQVIVELYKSSNEQNIFLFINNRKIEIDYKVNKNLLYYLSNKSVNNIYNLDSLHFFIRHKNEKEFSESNELGTIILPGDEIFVKTSYVNVMGNVNEQKQIPYNPYLKINDYITLAGGLTEDGSLSKITIMDSTGKKKSKKNPIESGDVILVGNSNRILLKDFSTVMGILSSTINVIILGIMLFK